MTESIARRTLQRALFFLTQARSVGVEDRVSFLHYFESAIVFGRSVTFHLQSEYAHSTGFESWYRGQQERMRADSLARFFVDKRNFVLKEGQLSIGKHADIEIHATVKLSTSVHVLVSRGQPWYRRSSRILVEDMLRPLRGRLNEWRKQRHRARADMARARGRQATVTQSLRFADETWRDQPALELLERYLRGLEPLVSEAERQFAAQDGQQDVIEPHE